MCWTWILGGSSGSRGVRGCAGGFLLMSLCLLVVQVRADQTSTKDRRYSWKTGQWGRCVGEECGSGGAQSRTVRCVHAEGWTTHHSNCRHTDKPESQRPCFKVCEWHQDLFEWEVSEWGACVLAVPPTSEGQQRATECVTAQHGLQRRRARCVRAANGTSVTERICEFFSLRPALEQACLIPCPLDCVVSVFSPWSACSRTCGAGRQHRTRHVLAAPMYGGADCPGLTQTQSCRQLPPCPSGEGEHGYSLKVAPWSECRRPQHKDLLWLGGRTTLDFGVGDTKRNTVKRHDQSAQHHLQLHLHHSHHPHLPPSKVWEVEIGYRTRQVRCMSSDGKNAILSLCTQDDGPRTFQSCVIPKHCQTSDWSAWSPCSKTCQASDLSPGYRMRTRTITQPAIGGGNKCPAREEKEACNIIGDLLPKCPRYVWRSTDWGECHVAPLLSQQDRRLRNTSGLCGGGIQTRDTYCVQVLASAASHHSRAVSRPVSAHLCDGVIPLAVRSCSLPCPQPCLLSSWSSWGPCLHDNCMESQERKGYRQRRRQVLGEGSGNTENCGHLLESVPCEAPACFLWRVQAEGVCMSRDGTCGHGSRNHTVACVNSRGEPVVEGFCKDDPPPVQVACEIACPGGCVVSSWSDWSSCSHSCTNKNAEGRQSRMRSVLAWPGEGGKTCPPASALEHWRPCNDHPCVVLYWETSAWGPCVEGSSVAVNRSSHWNETSPCAEGVQTRTVTCVKINTGPVVPKRCPDSARPDSARPCVLACKRDCLVTQFSEWTACPQSCVPANVTMPTQSRYRTVVQRPANGGQECPDTLFEERECEALPVCSIYRWRTHRWHPCTLVPDSVRQGMTGASQSCGRGLETRALSCMDENEEPAAMSECLQWAGRMPTQVRTCWVPCRDDCTFSTWSRFTECTGCGSSSRKRSLTGRSRKREHCHREDQYPLVDTQPCPCVEFLSKPWGSWSPCILPEAPAQGPLLGWRGQKEALECGGGLRYRAVACLDQRGRLLDPAVCNGTELQVETCHVSCPLDCRLSSWSAWSACSASCGNGLKVRSKWLREKPFNGGRPCPKLDLKNQAQVYEAVPCLSECWQYEWVSESWSLCAVNSVDKLPACGEGVQTRKIRCVMHGSGDQGRSVNDSLCDPDDIPAQAQTCVLPCPDDCVMSPWSPWSPCPTPCDPNTVRTRTRRMLRPPADGAGCPESNQTEPCVANSNCFTYKYNVSDWSTCMLNEKAVCGEGVRTRLLDCMRSDGRVMATSMCEELGLPQPWKLMDTCQVDCPVSCILSEWSVWTECSHACGNQGVMLRTRRVLHEAHEEGRPCAFQLSQTKPCPIRPCYSWLLGAWSPCRVEGAECGEGVRERNLSCIVHWGHWPESPGPRPDAPGPPLTVEEERCGERLQRESEQELQQLCFLPCPGDCHLTEWSSWSSCQLTCLEGRSFEAEGHQARSQAVIIQTVENQESCPQQVFETRPCKGGKCHSYEWRTSTWNNNERSVWCQRSDGVNVTGGCFEINRPAGVRHCHPPCTKPFSQCKQSGVCGCERGYTEVMTTHGFLDYCTKTPGGDHRKADVKTSTGRQKPGPSQIQDFFGEWSLQALSPDGRIKMWVYGATAGGFLLILFIIAMSFLLCSRPAKQNKKLSPPQKALALAYDGDVDM
ncbi:thrombospondin type-1 domain-containing protein 7B isoform X3 [Electrophorus electricus]|uniref:thrombospondin type-1 domain-containing protein 7B isoform X3 n=1 Tax=Electrophorus electricus TaxID=8005 RepID=UPI0015D05B52|nr:thrombospondin type-1 domain-containing protein 7B isoform X3 [Electrophorus electricus]